ncbi:MAG: transposase [Pseudobutyrivibrio sp.]|nr:transposase [Pseudobutyrivibrio sp.]
MNRNKFTKREMQLIKNNPYTYKVTENQIFYTKEFKEEFWRRYQDGESPRAIVEALGYDPDMLGQYRINGLQINIQKQANRPGGFTEGKGRRKGRKSELYSVDNNPSDETIIKMQHELLYLRQEVEFLKKITSLKDTKK